MGAFVKVSISHTRSDLLLLGSGTSQDLGGRDWLGMYLMLVLTAHGVCFRLFPEGVAGL
jgi:hypothetical protein